MRAFDKANEYCRWARELRSKVVTIPQRLCEDDIFVLMTNNLLNEGKKNTHMLSLIEFYSFK